MAESITPTLNPPLALALTDPPIAGHAAIGDRRCGALVCADSTINWWCLPTFDGKPVFATLLDPEQGGFCRFGPVDPATAVQSYLPQTTASVIRWDLPGANSTVELADVMAWPDDERPARTQRQRAILRRLRITGNSPVEVELRLSPRWNFGASRHPLQGHDSHTARWIFDQGTLNLWADFPCEVHGGNVSARLTVAPGEERWVVIVWDGDPAEWSAQRAAETFEAALAYWRDWSSNLDLECVGECTAAAERSALTVQLLSHVEFGSAVAALTTSLPERYGGERNYDYRYAWVRDGSLALAYLARLGKAGEVRCYLAWLDRLGSGIDAPLQVVYQINGNTRLDEHTVDDIRGYQASLPVRVGNRAARQRQLGSSSFFTDCVRLYLEHGGNLEERHWGLIAQVADHTASNWQHPDSGIWELEQKACYVSSRVMAWSVLDCARCIADKTRLGEPDQLARWEEQATIIHAEVMDKGWSEQKQSFRQRYGDESLDAALLLVPLLKFLPPEHPRVLGTLRALERELVVGGLMHRFDPGETLGGKQLPIGQFEGAFLPCVFWHAHLLASVGRVDEARALLARCDRAAGPAGLYAEEMNAADDTFRGNTPLLFSHVEYVRAAIAINHASKKQPQS